MMQYNMNIYFPDTVKYQQYQFIQMKIFILSALLLALTLAASGVDVATLVTKEQFSCLQSTLGVSFAAVRALRSFGSVDPAANQTIQNAADAGIDFVDPYITLCRGMPVADQVNSFIENLGDTWYVYVWIHIQANPSPGCSWSGYTPQQNCQYINDTVNAILAAGKYPGFFSSSNQWTQILGSVTGCPYFSDYPLWYANFDNTQSYADFTSFGGWTTPSRKQYKGTVDVCGVTVNQNWYHQC